MLICDLVFIALPRFVTALVSFFPHAGMTVCAVLGEPRRQRQWEVTSRFGDCY